MAAPFATTRAVRRLATWRGKPGHTAGLLARACGVTEATVRRWFRGYCRPAEHLRPAVYVVTGAWPRWWRTPAEIREHRVALRRARVAVAEGPGATRTGQPRIDRT